MQPEQQQHASRLVRAQHARKLRQREHLRRHVSPQRVARAPVLLEEVPAHLAGAALVARLQRKLPLLVVGVTANERRVVARDRVLGDDLDVGGGDPAVADPLAEGEGARLAEEEADRLLL